MQPPRLDHFHRTLEKRKEEGIFRSLKPRPKGFDFYSNDYLGFARNDELRQLLLERIQQNPRLLSGSTGSRLISGNSSLVEETETCIAQKHQYPCALLFSSGYQANLALFSALLRRGDTVIVDEHIHRSVHDACRITHARKLKFYHNHLDNLEDKLRRTHGNCYIAVESLYSMEGDFAPLAEIARLAEKYSAHLLVDEAHALGTFGYGLVARHQLQDRVLATVITYGKALGAHGAAVLTNSLIKSYLVNFSSPFIYTTSAQDIQWMTIKTGYEFLEKNQSLCEDLQRNIRFFRSQGLETPSSQYSPIQSILVPNNQRIKALQQELQEKRLITYAVCSPTIKEGAERLRVCLHSFNSERKIVELTQTIKNFNSQ
ncbi:MAG: aminotransferase class I/II-fold pyridoxal phosphate-dependent enzyme [Bergeyella sp.]|nr:aminotransferase class I/II-fold pyridoxal phosphate-dependent enzyme [Bergeyella sp.]